MEQVTTIGLDFAKHVFQANGASRCRLTGCSGTCTPRLRSMADATAGSEC